MKLLTKINKYYFIFLVFLAPGMIVADYYLVQYLVNREVNDILENECERIKFHLSEEGELPASNYLLGVMPAIGYIPAPERFGDTLIYEAYADKLIPYRTYECTVPAGAGTVRIALSHVLWEMNELIVWLSAITSLLILLLITALFFINQGIYNRAWKPFFRNLSELKHYDITKKNPVRLETSRINEFEALNEVVTTLMNQVEKDFQNLKEFNENISHEMQTPLAIIRNKMILLLESQNFNEKELQWVQAAYQEANKLSKIGKSLTLISRIENQEFTRLDSVDVRAMIDNIVSNMEEIIHFKKLEITAKLSPVKIKCDPVLANVLFSNLIKNAIQHNREGGYIQMVLSEEKFEIENTGEVLEIEPVQLLNRFQKGNPATDSPGLGLAINQKICEAYGFRLDYGHHEGKHKISLSF
ncbi:MAG: HAMP domain-containing histidine kinase [Phaeodactylibacter sp.]|nr:HAMP domain-containing histidine kinase [Phaeodactylibacter sp.]